MHQSTPQLHPGTNPTSLKNAIMQKILSNKKILNKQVDKKLCNQAESCIGEKKYELQLLESIVQYELQEYPGYISFKEWKKINTKFWGQKITIYAESLWKIMRFINEGQVIVPTGMVYQIINCLITCPTQVSLKTVFQSFLSKNCKKKDLSSYRQLKNYPSFREIINGYNNKMEKQQRKEFKEQKNTINVLIDRISKADREKQRYLTHLRYQSLADQMKKCSFKPQISQYTSQIKKEKKQKHEKCFMNQLKQEQFLKNFKARPLDQKIFDGSIKKIPGALKHIHKQQYCEQERLRLRRFQERSTANYI